MKKEELDLKKHEIFCAALSGVLRGGKNGYTFDGSVKRIKELECCVLMAKVVTEQAMTVLGYVETR